MADDTRHWLETELPDELRDVLNSAHEDYASVAQVARLRAGVENAVGPAAFGLRDVGANASRASEQSMATRIGAQLSSASPVAWTGLILAIAMAGLSARTLWTRPAPLTAAVPAEAAQRRDARVIREIVQPTAPAPSIAERPPFVPPAISPPLATPAPLAPTRANARETAPARATASLAEELRSLERIRSHMSEPQRALTMAERHAQKFAGGSLVPERELLQLEALLKAGQLARAQRLADRITTDAANHPYRAQALRLMAEHDQ
jgi:hypothetical protein